MRWWTWLLDAACSNTRSATLPYFELDTQAVSSSASIGYTVIGRHSYVRNRSRQSIMSASIVFRHQEDIALANTVAEHSVLQYSISYIIVHQTIVLNRYIDLESTSGAFAP